MAVQTGNPLAGIVTYFGLAPAATPTGPVDDISDFLDGVESSEDTDELDATTFRRASKNILAGFATNNISLSGKWSKSAHTFFSPLRKKTGVNYEYGPEGKEIGDVKIFGTCNVLSYSGPVATVDGITTFTVELRLNAQTDGTFAAATGATAGTPGSFTPVGCGIPATLTALQTGSITATPATAWTTGQSVVLGDGSTAHWNGTAWTAGVKP
jgi:hypothetical protein